MKLQTKPTRQTAIKILELLSFGLVKGLGKPEPGKMCVEAAVCYAMGLPHSDEPSCVSPIVCSFKIALNDCYWSSEMARANGLKRLAIAQLGSENIDNAIFVKELALSVVKKIIPIALRAVAKLNSKHSESLIGHAEKCERVVDLSAASYAARDASYAARYASYAASAASYAARAASYAARDAASDASDASDASYASDASAASYAASYAARAASDAASDASAARYAASAARYAASAASDAASAASDAASDAASAARYAASAASDAARDAVLHIMAECAVEALIKAKSPGCKWLNLAPKY